MVRSICSKILKNKLTRNICFKENTTVPLIIELIDMERQIY